MELSLHANATTTPKVWAYIQRSRKPVADLAIKLGVSETTIRRWYERVIVNDCSHVPETLTTSLSALEEALVCEREPNCNCRSTSLLLHYVNRDFTGVMF
jgi:hypothetical protein